MRRDHRAGFIAIAWITIPGFLGLVISSRYSSPGPRAFDLLILPLAAMMMVMAAPFAYDFGSRSLKRT
ncbi:MAG: hypothetical protein AAF937_07075 [Planctomycetota bacterium]